MSVLSDNPVAITLAPDREAERPFSPKAASLKNHLLLEDRGYQEREFFVAVQDADGSFIVRGTKSIRPTIRTARDSQGRRLRHLEGRRLSWSLLPRHDVDLDIDWKRDSGKPYSGRLVVIYAEGKQNKAAFVYLHTNLPRETFSAHDVGQIYRLRWQVELLFKEWKSRSNLHKFDTGKAPIAEGLIWASLLAATLKRCITHAAERGAASRCPHSAQPVPPSTSSTQSWLPSLNAARASSTTYAPPSLSSLATRFGHIRSATEKPDASPRDFAMWPSPKYLRMSAR